MGSSSSDTQKISFSPMAMAQFEFYEDDIDFSQSRMSLNTPLESSIFEHLSFIMHTSQISVENVLFVDGLAS